MRTRLFWWRNESTTSQVMAEVVKAAANGCWVLLLYVHLNNSLVQKLVAYMATSNDTTLHPNFRLILYCPTEYLHCITGRRRMICVELGADVGVEAGVMIGLHALASPTAHGVGLLEPDNYKRFGRVDAALFHKLAFGLCLSWAVATQVCPSVVNLAISSALHPKCFGCLGV